MTTERKRRFDQQIADLKTASLVVVLEKFIRSIQHGTVRSLPNSKPIVREQRVKGKPSSF